MERENGGIPWLGLLREEIQECGPGLILCRTSAQVRSLRRLIAARGGLLGLHLATPEALALATMIGPLFAGGSAPSTDEVPDCTLLRQIGERVRLQEHAKEWARTLRLHVRATGDAEGLPAELVELADSGWGLSEAEAAISRLLDQLADTMDPTSAREALGFGAVWCHGYLSLRDDDAPAWENEFLADWLPEQRLSGRPLLPVATWEIRLLEALDARPLPWGEAPATWSSRAPLPAVFVPDVTAEARLAVGLLRAQGSPEEACLVLVPDAGTAARLRDAGQRNGLAIAEVEASPLARHPLGRVVRVAADWFSGAVDPQIRASHLLQVLGDGALGQALPGDLGPTLDGWVAALFEGSPEELPERPLHLARKQLSAAIAGARIIEAPLSSWIARTGDLAEDAGTGAVSDDPESSADERRRRRQAKLLQARLRLLGACISGVEVLPPGEGAPDAIPGEEPDWVGPEIDGFGEAEEPPTAAAEQDRPGTFGALRRFLLMCKVRIHEDPAGMAILGALQENAVEPVGGPAVEALLAGRCATGLLSDGVEVMLAEDYDGRPTSLVLLLGVHDKGLGSPPGPDPLAGDDVLRRVGRTGRDDTVKFRLLQALRAAGSARTALALVSHRDETGRWVVPPVEFRLDTAAGARVLPEGLSPERVDRDSFGLGLALLPETASRAGLRRVEAAALQADLPPAPSYTDDRLAALAIQASAEWYRVGRGIGQRPLPGTLDTNVYRTPLSELISAVGETAPPWLAPWLGRVPPTERGRLDPGRSWSVSGHFRPMTHCLYQLFALRVLGLRKEDEVSEDLLPREIGDAVHDALEALGDRIPWQAADEAAAVATRERALTLLVGGVQEQFRARLETFRHLPPSTGAAVEGLAGRWANRWPDYLRERIRTEDTLEATAGKLVAEFVAGVPGYDRAYALLDAHYSGWTLADPKKRTGRLRAWLTWAFLAHARGVALDGLDEKELLSGQDTMGKAKLPGQGALKGLMPELVAREDLMGLLRDAAPAVTELLHAAEAVHGVLVQTWSEVSFGRGDSRDVATSAAQLGLSFRGAPLSVHGRIDSLRRRACTGRTTLQVLDYKSGATKSRAVLDAGLTSLRMPQLLVYALALRDLIRRGVPPLDIPGNADIGSVAYDYLQGNGGSGLTEFLLTPAFLECGRQVLTDLLARADRGDWALSPHPSECPVLQGKGGDYCPFAGSCRFQAWPTAPDLSAGDDPAMDEEGDA